MKKTFIRSLSLILVITMLILAIPISVSASPLQQKNAIRAYFKLHCEKPGYTFTVYRVANFAQTKTGAIPPQGQDYTSEYVSLIPDVSESILAGDTAAALDILDGFEEMPEGVVVEGTFTSSESKKVQNFNFKPLGIYYVRATEFPAGVKSVTNSLFAIPYYDGENWVETQNASKALDVHLATKVDDSDVTVEKTITNSVCNNVNYTTAGTDDVIEFEIRGTVTGSKTHKLSKYKFYDQMSCGLTLNKDSFNVSLLDEDGNKIKDLTGRAGDAATGDEYNIVIDEQPEIEWSETYFTVELTNDYLQKDDFYNSNVEYVSITYTATLNSNAPVGSNYNYNDVTKLEYANKNGVTDEAEGNRVYVYTFGIQGFKYDEKEQPLQGSKFEVFESMEDAENLKNPIAWGISDEDGLVNFYDSPITDEETGMLLTEDNAATLTTYDVNTPVREKNEVASVSANTSSDTNSSSDRTVTIYTYSKNGYNKLYIKEDNGSAIDYPLGEYPGATQSSSTNFGDTTWRTYKDVKFSDDISYSNVIGNALLALITGDSVIPSGSGNLVMFCNTLGWSDVDLYTSSEDFWNDSGCSTNNTSHYSMTKIENTNYWYVYIPVGQEYLLFKGEWYNGTNWYSQECYTKRNMTMFTPATSKTHTIGEVVYYNDGSWTGKPELGNSSKNMWLKNVLFTKNGEWAGVKELWLYDGGGNTARITLRRELIDLIESTTEIYNKGNAIENNTKYSADLWANFADCYEYANEIVNDVTSTQSDIDYAVSCLSESHSALKPATYHFVVRPYDTQKGRIRLDEYGGDVTSADPIVGGNKFYTLFTDYTPTLSISAYRDLGYTIDNVLIDNKIIYEDLTDCVVKLKDLEPGYHTIKVNFRERNNVLVRVHSNFPDVEDIIIESRHYLGGPIIKSGNGYEFELLEHGSVDITAKSTSTYKLVKVVYRSNVKISNYDYLYSISERSSCPIETGAELLDVYVEYEKVSDKIVWLENTKEWEQPYVYPVKETAMLRSSRSDIKMYQFENSNLWYAKVPVDTVSLTFSDGINDSVSFDNVSHNKYNNGDNTSEYYTPTITNYDKNKTAKFASGKYYIVETEAPFSYNVYGKVIEVDLTATFGDTLINDTYIVEGPENGIGTFTLYNTKLMLPITGGTGRIILYCASAIIAGIGFVTLYSYSRKKKKRMNNT